MDDFNKLLNSKIDAIEGHLNRFLPSEEDYPEIIYKAMRYSVFAGGKRLRPLLLLECCDAFGGREEEAAPFACAIEMIHTYSLIHDDLPAMDNDDYRRGRLTSHKAFGEDIAILAGDALLSEAFEIMARACVLGGDIRFVRAMEAIAAAAGTRGMLGGQVVDVTSEGKKIDLKTLQFIHKNKTAAMIQGAMKAGAILGGAMKDEVNRLYDAGEKIGVAFQIQDDILDVTSSASVLGKPVFSDEKNQKVTYVTMFGVEESEKLVKKLSDEAIGILESFGARSGFLVSLTQSLIGRQK